MVERGPRRAEGTATPLIRSIGGGNSRALFALNPACQKRALGLDPRRHHAIRPKSFNHYALREMSRT